MTKDIIITCKDGEVLNLYFKNILDLNEDEFKELTSKLSDIKQFKNENGKGVFYKKSTDTNPSSFQDMSLIEKITKYKETCDPKYSEDESLLSIFALFSKDDKQALAYASFFFYPESPHDKPDHFLEPDLIFFKEIRGKGISHPIIACLMADIFQKIIADERLDVYGALYSTVHPDNLPSRKILESLGFKYRQIDEELSKQSGSTESIELSPLMTTGTKKSQETQTTIDSESFQYLLNSEIIENSFLVKISEDLDIRLMATNKDRPLELFKKIKTILENYRNYQEGIDFLTEQIEKLARESNIADFPSQAIKNKNEKSSQTCFTQDPSPDEAPVFTNRSTATLLTSERRGRE
jgi:RimJ/RimL family protein N-acetyltransferase